MTLTPDQTAGSRAPRFSTFATARKIGASLPTSEALHFFGAKFRLSFKLYKNWLEIGLHVIRYHRER